MEKVTELEREKMKTGKAYHDFLPTGIVKDLKKKKNVAASQFRCVTIFYGEILDFDDLTKDCSASEVCISLCFSHHSSFITSQLLEFINLFYANLDLTLTKFQVFNALTMSDEFMVVSGMPQNIGNITQSGLGFTEIVVPGDQHVVEIASMALDLLASAVVFQIPHRPSAKLIIRMGIHR